MMRKRIFFKIEFPKTSLPPQIIIHAKHDATFHPMTPKITESELDGYIDLLIRELEQIRKEGKRKFTAWHTKPK
jgi:hypothetical protein